jgi:hypothetical protein
MIPITNKTWTMKKTSYDRFRKKLDAVTPIASREKPAKIEAYWPGSIRRNVEPPLTRLWIYTDACRSMVMIVVYPAQRCITLMLSYDIPARGESGVFLSARKTVKQMLQSASLDILLVVVGWNLRARSYHPHLFARKTALYS